MESNLKQEILDIIKSETGREYIGKLNIEKEDMNPPLWGLMLYLDLELSPIVLAYQGSEQGFKDFIKAEMKSRKMQVVKFWKAVKEYNDE